MRKEASHLGILVLVVAGCGKGTEESVFTRLQNDSPVIQQKLKVSDCKIDDQELDESSPLRARRNESLELTGVIAPKEWEIGGLMNGWSSVGNDGAGVPRCIPPNKRLVNIVLLVHGSDITKNFGIVDGKLINARPLKADPSEFEFRVAFKAPSSSGKYVVDLQAIDQEEVDGKPLTKPAGFPIWRREICVE